MTISLPDYFYLIDCRLPQGLSAVYFFRIAVSVKNRTISSPVSLSGTFQGLITNYRILIKHDPVYIFRKKGERDFSNEEIALSSGITKEEWSQWIPGIWLIDHWKKKLRRFHPIRHSGASLMESGNIPIGSIQRILGHENRTTTEIYLDSIGDSEVQAIQAYENARRKSHTQKKEL